ncbi:MULTISPECIES: alpha/beta hydrolase [unclassified Gilliamella]|uniref:alpha/beta hydrolase n=1 Tax=unclassified Gilliamella TaxID=2685620 RepID=UPI0013296C9F|nr:MULTISPECIES: alpha/beta hydrolase [unclassified Gilliamella]MWN30951.1 alpha/beta hydrolase [Gilliamella sp. Pra-s60]MWP28484.1 alpha/beta hydrolase [Gilliamella sp. Pra-s54]
MVATENLTAQIFKPQFDYPETSTLIKRIDSGDGSSISALDGEIDSRWYRIINAVLWHWRGLPKLEAEAVLSKIAASTKHHTNDKWLDTVVGYQSGNWVYEFLNQAAIWQTKAESFDKTNLTNEDKNNLLNYYLIASELSSIASYPHFKNDELAMYAQTCAYQSYTKALNFSAFLTKELEFKVDNRNVKAILHLPKTEGTCPVVLICNALGNLQIDYYRYFSEFLAPYGFAMLTVDLPTVGYSRNFALSQNSSQIHQAIIEQLPSIPWIDNNRIIVAGFRFGSHIATRLAYLMPNKIKGLFNFTPLIHQIFVDKTLQKNLPNSYKDMLASRLGLPSISNQQLAAELNYFSLKNQGLLNHACQVPVMNIIFEDDKLSNLCEAKLIHSTKQNKVITVSKKQLQKSLHQALAQSVKWMESVL